MTSMDPSDVVLFHTVENCEAWAKKFLDEKVEKAKRMGTSKEKLDRFTGMETVCMQVQIVHSEKLRNPRKPKSWDD